MRVVGLLLVALLLFAWVFAADQQPQMGKKGKDTDRMMKDLKHDGSERLQKLRDALKETGFEMTEELRLHLDDLEKRLD